MSLATHPSRPIACISIALLMTASACASVGAPVSTTDPLTNAPEWVKRGCRVHGRSDESERDFICAIGSARGNRNAIALERTAIARARTAIARNIEVTIESLVRVEEDGSTRADGELLSIIHQLTSTSLPGCRLESTWQSSDGEFFALVSLAVDHVRESLRQTPGLSSSVREDLAARGAMAFASDHDSPRAEGDDLQ